MTRVICGFILTGVIAITFYHWFKWNADPDYECSGVVRALSLMENMKKLGDKDKENYLPVLNGLRVLSIFYVLIGHRFMYINFIPFNSWNSYENLTSSFEWILITSGDLVVDNFFLISGILMSYKLMKWEPGCRLNFKKLIFARYMRFIPLYIMAIAFRANVLPLLGSGPLWMVEVGVPAVICKMNFWINLLMINNYVDPENMCLGQTWFIPCVFHFFLLSLSVLWLLRSKSSAKIGLVYLGVLLVVSMVIPCLVAYYKDIPFIPALNRIGNNDPDVALILNHMYFPSHTRANPYLVGLLAGYLLAKYRKSNDKILSMKTSVLVTLASLAVMVTIISSRFFIHQNTVEQHPVLNALYMPLHRSLWAVAVCSIILCCSLGEVPAVTAILGWSTWTPFSRLVYGVYLIHACVDMRSVGVMWTPYQFDFIKFFAEIAADAFYSFGGAFLLYLFVEAPCRELIINLLSGTDKKTEYNTDSSTLNTNIEEYYKNTVIIVNSKNIHAE